MHWDPDYIIRKVRLRLLWSRVHPGAQSQSKSALIWVRSIEKESLCYQLSLNIDPIINLIHYLDFSLISAEINLLQASQFIVFSIPLDSHYKSQPIVFLNPSQLPQIHHEFRFIIFLSPSRLPQIHHKFQLIIFLDPSRLPQIHHKFQFIIFLNPSRLPRIPRCTDIWSIRSWPISQLSIELLYITAAIPPIPPTVYPISVF